MFFHSVAMSASAPATETPADDSKKKDGHPSPQKESKGTAASTSDDSGIQDTSTPSVSSPGPTDGRVSSSDEDEGGDGVFSSFLSLMKDKLKISSEPEESQQVLKSLDLAGVVDYIKSNECKNIITMAGAGISTSAGIPDFRSEGSGLYSNLQKYDLPYPEAIFELRYFAENPQPFFTLAKELYPGSFNPTPCHYFIKLLEKKGLLLRHYTQNIDTLEHVAGISGDKLVEAHGSFRTAHCLLCRKEYTQGWVKDELFADRVPTCECAGVVKPDIVFFGEGLPSRFFKCLGSDFPSCDLLIIMGTSLTVQPFASLIDNVPPSCPRLLVNRETVGEADTVLSSIQRLMGKGGLMLHSKHNTRDVALLGDCDDGCRALAEQLGWKEELDEMITPKGETKRA